MTDLRYEAPESLNAAVMLLAGAQGQTRVLAGGTDVIVQLEMDLIEPELIVDIKKIPEIRGIFAAWPGVIEGIRPQSLPMSPPRMLQLIQARTAAKQ